MRRVSIVLLVLVLSFSTLFTGFGYAKLTSTLLTSAQVNVTPVSDIFITNVQWQASQDAVWQINSYTMRVMNTTATLGESANARVSYQVEFLNNTDKDMAYIRAFHDSMAYDNEDIVYTISNVLDGQRITAGGRLTLTITFTWRDGVSTDNILHAVVGFQFGEAVDFEEEEEQEKEDGTFEPSTSYHTLVHNILTNSNRYGLNDSHKGYVIHNALKSSKILYSGDHTTGGNIDKLYEALQIDSTKNIDFVFEYVSETEYVVYLFDRKNALEGKDIMVYKQHFHYDTTSYNPGRWVEGTALRGHAVIKRIKSSVYSIVPSEWEPGLPPGTEE